MTPTIGAIFPPPPPSAVGIPHPSTVVPYLFGGLAAMLALIALALLILACSYLRHTANNIQTDLEAAAGDKLEKSGNLAPALKETIVVIMAGDANPSFLGTAMSMTGSTECCCGEAREKVESEKEDEDENEKEDV